ncbi:hypothetical protein AB3X96_25980 [Paraburkholderia sp. BR13439]|uniref:SLAC1 family transporter n=1 Tax=Paraburkholderia sp. BR13439 TaxID=3236996 RepID=UPI0034CE21A9
MPALKPRQSWLHAFPPTAFAIVMATGIVSVAAHLLDDDLVGWLLLGINAVTWPVLLAITLCRLLRYPRGACRCCRSQPRAALSDRWSRRRPCSAANYRCITSCRASCHGSSVSRPRCGSSSPIRLSMPLLVSIATVVTGSQAGGERGSALAETMRHAARSAALNGHCAQLNRKRGIA